MKQALLTLADYHNWTFEILYANLAPLSNEQYRKDVGLFFGSVHRTLNHLLVADQIWFGRCIGTPVTGIALNTELETARDQLQQRLLESSARWRDLIESLDTAQLSDAITYTNMAGARFTQPLPSLLFHVFNHGTHHRGQISAAITACSVAAPEMDLINYLRLPRSER